MKKIHLIELVSDFLTGGDSTGDMQGRFHEQIIKKHLEAAFNNLVFQTYMEGKTHSDYSVLDAWARKYTIDIDDLDEEEATGNAKLPYPPMQLPNNMGILQVNEAGDLTNTFAYRETNSNSVFAALEVGLISEKPIFYLEQNTTGDGTATHLLQLENLPDEITQVDIKLIVPLEEIDDFDEVMIPAGKEELLIRDTIELLMSKPPEDNISDGRPNR
jgi:hypothetical protein